MLRTALIASVTTTLLLASNNACADTVDVYFSSAYQGASGNRGATFRPKDSMGNNAAFEVTAMSMIDQTKPFDPNAVGSAGTVYFDGSLGLGVQTDTASGSKGISGGGGHKDEALIFKLDAPVAASSIRVGLTDYEAGSGLNNKDDVVIFINIVGLSDALVFNETHFMSAFTSTGSKRGVVNFALLGLGDSLVSSFSVRETNDHMFVNMISYDPNVIPLPPAVALGLAGIVGVGVYRRRKNARS